MAEWNRFDIAEAYCVLEWDYNEGGWLQERPSNRRRMEATSVQRARMQFVPRMDLSFDTLEENAKEIYMEQALKLNLPIPDEDVPVYEEFFVREYLMKMRPEVFGK